MWSEGYETTSERIGRWWSNHTPLLFEEEGWLLGTGIVCIVVIVVLVICKLKGFII